MAREQMLAISQEEKFKLVIPTSNLFLSYLELRQQFFSYCGRSRVILSGFSSFEDLINIHFLQNTKGVILSLRTKWGRFIWCKIKPHTCGSCSSPSGSLKSSSAPNFRMADNSSLLNGAELHGGKQKKKHHFVKITKRYISKLWEDYKTDDEI